MKNILIISMLLYSFTNTYAQDPEHHIEIQIEFQCEYDIAIWDNFHNRTFNEVWLQKKDTIADAFPVTVLDAKGFCIVPFTLNKYEHFMVGTRKIFYQTFEGEVGYYNLSDSRRTVLRQYKELLSIHGDTILVRNNKNMVGLVTYDGKVIIPFEYYHAWGDGIDYNDRILMSRGRDTWEFNLSGTLLKEGRL